jgi:hypothetical protein
MGLYSIPLLGGMVHRERALTLTTLFSGCIFLGHLSLAGANQGQLIFPGQLLIVCVFC